MSPSRRRLVSVIGLIVAAGATAPSRAAETARADMRANREAVAVFRQVIADREAPLVKCQLSEGWSQYGVPYDIARTYLGLTVHGNLIAPDEALTPEQVIGDADGRGILPAESRYKDLFCSKDEFTKYVEASTEARSEVLKKAFAARPPDVAKPADAGQPADGAKPAVDTKAPAAKLPSLDLIRTTYGFPIFDRTFSRAVVIWQSESSYPRFNADGTRGRGSIDGGGSALEYRRRGGRWLKVDNVDLYSFD